MRYTKIPETTFKEIQLNAGILLNSFAPETGEVLESDFLAATSGGVSFSATPSFVDFGDDIDNCPKNTKELKKLESWEVKMSGTFAAANTELAKKLIGAADIDSEDTTKINPRNDITDADFADLWWVGDYSDKTGDTNGGYIAIHMLNTLSTGGFQVQSTDKKKGKFSFEFTAHYSIEAQDTVPFEVYIKAGTAEA
ncbi:MAG: hypothetical protein ACI4JY_08780 [Oscillospiraceae bacterium]